MKIAINADFGGFDLSDKALELLLTRKNIPFEKSGKEFYQPGHAGDEEYRLYSFDFYEYVNRNDVDLVAVIEELGEEANGVYSSLKIVEIPDDVDWYVTDYDGLEHVAEKHRTWS